MKYSARLVTALAAVALLIGLVVGLTTEPASAATSSPGTEFVVQVDGPTLAQIETTAPTAEQGAFYASWATTATITGFAIVTVTILTGLAFTRGGYFLQSSVSTFARWVVKLTNATARSMTVNGFGRGVKTTIPMHETQHRHLATATYGHRHDDGMKGTTRRGLSRKIPTGLRIRFA